MVSGVMVSGCDGEWRYGEWVVRGLGVVVRGCWGDLCGYYVEWCHDEWGHGVWCYAELLRSRFISKDCFRGIIRIWFSFGFSLLAMATLNLSLAQMGQGALSRVPAGGKGVGQTPLES